MDGTALKDTDGLELLDDGYQTVKAAKDDFEQYFNNTEPDFEWPANYVEVFDTGVEVDYVCYEEGYDRDLM